MTFHFNYPYKKRTVIHRRPVRRPSIFFGRPKDVDPERDSSRSISTSATPPGPQDHQETPFSPLSQVSSTPTTSSPRRSISFSPPESASTAPTSLDAYSSSNGSRFGLSKSIRSNSPTPSSPAHAKQAEEARGSDETTHTELHGPSNFRFPFDCREHHPIEPSISTVESAAAAKVFFETHYNTLLSSEPTSRQERCRLVESQLALHPMSREEKAERMRLWRLQESRHLRQTRALMSKSLARRKTRGISVAGYELVRVLGKGSFGVVRLVKERQPSHPKYPSTEQTESDIERLDGNDDEPGRYDPSKIARRVYAMKVIQKSKMLRNCQEGHLRAERDFLVASENSRWVVPLIASFQDSANLYLVMEYMVGGDFLGLLMRQDILDESTARWYIAEMILCVEEAHKMKWIHRDIKPDNFLITASGHLKISDFGLAFDGHWSHNQTYFNEKRYTLLKKFGIDVRGDDQDAAEGSSPGSKHPGFSNIFGRSQRMPSMFHLNNQPMKEPPGKEYNPVLWMNRHQKRRLAKSVVGTSQYMAPEVIRGEEYDGRCDWWSIGIILYECLYGQTPFYCQDRKDTKQKIAHHNHFLSFPQDQRWGGAPAARVPLAPVTYAAVNLMKCLLTDKEIRLSSPRYRENDIRHDCLPHYHQHSHHRSFSMRSPAASVLQHSSTVPTTSPFSAAQRHVSANVSPLTQPSNQRYFVFADDAREIKEHVFFHGIQWDRLHAMRPPFVPHIRAGQDLTKYFDDETQILSSGDDATDPDADSTLSVDDEGQPHDGQPHDGNVSHEDGEMDPLKDPALAETRNEEDKNNGRHWEEENEISKEKKKNRAKENKEKRRARDKLLRDPRFKRPVMEVRKNGAFLGYTYRRPVEVMSRRRCTMGDEAGFFAPPEWAC